MTVRDWQISLNEAGQVRLRPVGFWRSPEQPALPDPATQIDAGWDEAERRATLSYLQRAPVCERFCGYSTCRLCGRSGAELGDADRTDGKWIWPSGLPHYLEHHAVRPPEEFLSDLRAAGFRLSGPIVPAETTIGRLDPILRHGMVRSEDEHLVRLRLRRAATPRDLYLGVEVDRALGCYRLEMNDAALAAARLRSERFLHPPLWLRALRFVLPLLCTLLFALSFAWLVRRCSVLPGRQGTSALSRAALSACKCG